jgi:5-formyltetrahydrofolate cyclo-ligase
MREDARVEQTKADLRAVVRAARAARSPADRSAAALGLAAGGAGLLPEAGVIAGYSALPAEPGLQPLLALARSRRLTVLLPRVEGPDLVWTSWVDGQATRPGPFGIAEPVGPGDRHLAEAQVVLLPATAVDRHGGRLGQGGGFYDRALAALTGPRPLLVAVVFDDEVVDRVPTEPHDVPVDVLLTPTRVLRLPAH